MFDEKPVYSDLVAKLFELCRSLDRGDYLKHSQIQRVLGCAPHTGHWQGCMKKLARRLEAERGITIWSEREVGYKLLTEEEQIDVPLRRLRRAKRQIRRGIASLEALPDDDLTDHQRRMRAFRLQHNHDVIVTLRRDIQEQKAIARPTPTAPLRPVPVV